MNKLREYLLQKANTFSSVEAKTINKQPCVFTARSKYAFKHSAQVKDNYLYVYFLQ